VPARAILEITPIMQNHYLLHVRAYIRPHLAKIALQRLTALDIQRWVNGLAASQSPRSVQYYHATLRAALNQAVKWRLLSFNPATAVELPRRQKKYIEAMEEETARQILAAFEGHDLECFVTMLLTTGVRPGEALGLRWSDVDIQGDDVNGWSGTVAIQTGRSGGLKTEGSRRTLDIPEVLIRQLCELPRRSVLVFPDCHGDHRDGTTILHQFQRRLKECGLPKMTLYALRHGHATLQLTEGASLREIMEQLGHTQISTTANIYTHVAKRLKSKSAERMDRLFGT
jgi:integrase